MFYMLLFLYNFIRNQSDSNTGFFKVTCFTIVIKGNHYIKYRVSPVTLYSSNVVFWGAKGAEKEGEEEGEGQWDRG